MLCIKCKKEIPDTSVYCQFCGKKQVKTEKQVKDKKNPNGFGSIVKLGGRRRKPWAVVVTDGFENKKQKRRYIGYYETRTEAKEALAKEQICPSSPKSNITFSELYNEWLQTPAFRDISKQTQDNYTAAYKHLEKLYKAKFIDLRAKNYQVILDTLDRSKSTKQKIKILCGLLYKYAMQNDIINKNYAEYIKIKAETKTEKSIFTSDEIKLLEENVNLVKYVDTILILIYTGLRIGEMLELKRSAIDLENKTITGGLKTDAGRDRIVPISDKILEYLKKWCNDCISPDDYIFVRDDGSHITPNYYRKNIFYDVLEKLGIIEPTKPGEPKRLTPHSTRHTCATLLSDSGADVNSIKLILGHTDFNFTANTYVHTDVSKLHEAIKNI